MAAYGTVTVRLPQEIVESYKRQAQEQNKTISDIVREKLLNAEGAQAQPTELSAEIKEQLQDMNITIEASLNAVGQVISAAFRESAEARHYARLVTSYAIDMTRHLAEKKVLDKSAKEEKMKELDLFAAKESAAKWQRITGQASD
jgi:uncharacterized protein YqgV (UPF0045/DUF77 family)